MNILLWTLVIVPANLLGAAMAIPQARKLLRTRNFVGVSLTWAAVSAVVNAWWGAYGLAVGEVAIVPVSVVSVTVYLVIAVVIVQSTSGRTGWAGWAGWAVLRAVCAAIAVSTVPIVALVVDGWLLAGVTRGALYGVQLAPAVVGVYRNADVSGVSVATWAMAFAEAALWGVHGANTRDAGIVTLAGTGVVMSSLVLARLYTKRPRPDVDVAPVGGFVLATA